MKTQLNVYYEIFENCPYGMILISKNAEGTLYFTDINKAGEKYLLIENKKDFTGKALHSILLTLKDLFLCNILTKVALESGAPSPTSQTVSLPCGDLAIYLPPCENE